MSPAPGTTLMMTPAPATGGAWSPASLPLAGAWDFSDIAKITSSAGLVSQVTGAYGTSATLTQASGSNQFTTGTVTINGLNVMVSNNITFMGTSSGLAAQTQPFTYIALSRTNTLGGWNYVCGNNGCFMFMQQGGATYGLNAGTQQPVGTHDKALHIDIGCFNGASSTFHRDGVAMTVPGSPGTAGIAANNFMVSQNSSAGIQGDICEVWIISGVLSTPDRVAAENFLYTKWGFEAPRQIGGLAIWQDASDTSTLTIPTGSECSQWNDKSTQGRHLKQATSANRPLTGAFTINGNNVLKFDGSNDWMRTDTLSPNLTTTYYTLFVVAAFNTSSAHGFGSGFSGHWPYGDNSSAFDLFQPAGGPNGTTCLTRFGSAPPNNTPILYRLVLSSTGWASRAQCAGVAVTGTAAWTAGPVSVTATTFGVGDNNAGRYLNGYHCERLIYTRDLSAGEITTIENYLIAKWGVT